MSTLAAFSLVCGFLLSAYNGGALVAVFPPGGARHKHRPTLGTGPRLSPAEQGSTQPLVHWQNGGAEPFAVEGICDTLQTNTFFTIVQQEAVAVIIVTAAMYQSLNGSVLLVGQTDDVIGHTRPSAGWARHEALVRCFA